jgi:hypothetical protein
MRLWVFSAKQAAAESEGGGEVVYLEDVREIFEEAGICLKQTAHAGRLEAIIP